MEKGIKWRGLKLLGKMITVKPGRKAGTENTELI